MTTDPRISAASSALALEVGSGDPADLWITDAEIALAAADAVMFSEESIERAAMNLMTTHVDMTSYNAALQTVRAVVAALRGEA